MKEHKYVRQAKLIEMLHENHITQREFAAELGIKLDAISAKLHGRRQFSLQEAFRVADIFGKSVEEIFAKEETA